MAEKRLLSMSAALLEATERCLRTDPRVYLMGEGVADPKGIFGTTSGLAQKFGPQRVVEMPIAENGLTGIAIGSALRGRRPIMVHQRADFMLLALEQLFNNAAKAFFLSNGTHRVPLTIRLIIGRGWGQGPEHSQALEPLFAHMPGLKLALPSTPYEAKGMLIAAVEDENPVVILEHRWSHYITGDVPEGHYTVPLVGPSRAQTGDDVTIVASSYNMLEAAEAVEAMRQAGVSVDLFDLRVLRPLQIDPILESVRRTGRLIVLDLGWVTYGIGAEIVARVTESCLFALKAPPRRLGLPDYPTPCSRSLAAAYYPNSCRIVEVVATMLPGSAARLEAAREAIIVRRGAVPVDTPFPGFRGPF
jgi:acetoin:2,6-dichlorophenolindophenol oxidoreductase subunit beta